MKKLLTLAALSFGAFCLPGNAAPSGTIQYSIAQCDPNAPTMCEAYKGGAPTSAQAACDNTGTVMVWDAVTTAKAARIVSNISGVTIYVGPSGVTSSNGFPIPTGTVLDLTKATSALYCATAGAGPSTLNSLQY